MRGPGYQQSSKGWQNVALTARAGITHMRFLLILASLSLAALGGCASQWQLNTNLDPEAIESYFAPASVAMLNSGDGRPLLGPVAGEACQQPDHPPISAADARTALRAKAAELGAEAVVIADCVEFNGKDSPPDCLRFIQCHGHAYGAEKQQ